ncbi:MAG: FRG domain-containing protein [Anaerolineales bacterium]|nr:FRG domain-containing protein [Anaerolineales bacterium]
MRKIEPTLTKELIRHVGSKDVGKAQPYPIKTYRQLVEQVAHLSYLNKDDLLFFRGQTQDFLNKAEASTFYPSIYREDNLQQQEVAYRFEVLDQASRQLKELFKKNKVDGHSDVSRKRYIQWSILQHYSVCATPLLDFTHSLRVACSFAQQSNTKDNVFVYVFGFPYITNRITINSEHDIVNVRLLSICPPDALRPYFQEGYLAGTSDVTSDYDSKSELDFNNRLIAKFAIPNTKQFWGSELSKIPESMLYPKNDQIEKLCQSIETTIQTELHPGDIGEFLTHWVQLEQSILKIARGQEARPLSLRESIQHLLKTEYIDSFQAYRIDELRKFRNILVHEPKRLETNSISDQLQNLRKLQSTLHLDKKK